MSFAQVVDDSIRKYNKQHKSWRYVHFRLGQELAKARRWLELCGITVTVCKK